MGEHVATCDLRLCQPVLFILRTVHLCDPNRYEFVHTVAILQEIQITIFLLITVLVYGKKIIGARRPLRCFLLPSPMLPVVDMDLTSIHVPTQLLPIALPNTLKPDHS